MLQKKKHIAVISAMSTDLASNGGQIVDIAIIVCSVDGLAEVDRFETAVSLQSGEQFSEGAVSSLTPAVRLRMVDAPTREEAFSNMWYFISKYADMESNGNYLQVCGHNVRHIMGLLRNMSNYVGFPQFMNAFGGEHKDIMQLAMIINDTAVAKYGEAVYHYENGTSSTSLQSICNTEMVELNYNTSEDKADLLRLLWLTIISNLGDMMEAETKLKDRALSEGYYCPSCGSVAEVDTTAVYTVEAVKVMCIVCGKNHIVQEG